MPGKKFSNMLYSGPTEYNQLFPVECDVLPSGAGDPGQPQWWLRVSCSSLKTYPSYLCAQTSSIIHNSRQVGAGSVKGRGHAGGGVGPPLQREEILTHSAARSSLEDVMLRGISQK